MSAYTSATCIVAVHAVNACTVAASACASTNRTCAACQRGGSACVPGTKQLVSACCNSSPGASSPRKLPTPDFYTQVLFVHAQCACCTATCQYSKSLAWTLHRQLLSMHVPGEQLSQRAEYAGVSFQGRKPRQATLQHMYLLPGCLHRQRLDSYARALRASGCRL